MGGRGGGSSSGGGATGGVGPSDILGTTSLISARERSPEEVDAVLTVLRDVQEQYGVNVMDAQLATLKPGSGVMAYYDAAENLAINQSYFDGAKMDAAYDRCVSQGFHPGRGKKSGIEAVTAHEMGHRLTDAAGQRAGRGTWALDSVSRDIVASAAKSTGYGRSMTKFASAISGYAKSNWAETVAEAFSDVYCNGARAKRESRAVVTELNKYFT